MIELLNSISKLLDVLASDHVPFRSVRLKNLWCCAEIGCPIIIYASVICRKLRKNSQGLKICMQVICAIFLGYQGLNRIEVKRRTYVSAEFGEGTFRNRWNPWKASKNISQIFSKSRDFVITYESEDVKGKIIPAYMLN